MHINEFQEMMRRIYFHLDSKRGASETFHLLEDEVAELDTALEEVNHKAMVNEFADVLAWLASLANVVGVDLQDATMSKYNNACPKCQESPCKCPLSKKH